MKTSPAITKEEAASFLKYKAVSAYKQDGKRRPDKEIEKDLLKLFPETRDSNELMWVAQKIVKGALITQDLINEARGYYGKVETVRRNTKDLQEHNLGLQGAAYSSNQVHNSFDTLFSVCANPMLRAIANHKNLTTNGVWECSTTKEVWAFEKDGVVFIKQSAIRHRFKGDLKCEKAMLESATYAKPRKRFPKEKNSSACYAIPLADIKASLRAKDFTSLKDYTGGSIFSVFKNNTSPNKEAC